MDLQINSTKSEPIKDNEEVKNSNEFNFLLGNSRACFRFSKINQLKIF